MHRIRIIGILSVISLLVSCQGNVNNKIIGTWEMQSFYKDPPVSKVEWIFSTDRKITKIIVDENKTFVGNYEIVRASLKDRFNYLVISGLSAEYGDSALANDDGKYVIHKITNDQLVIERVEAYGRTEGVYKWYEFLKKQ